MKRFYYLYILLFLFVIPTVAVWFLLPNLVYFKALVPFVVLAAIGGTMIDVWATKHGRKDRVWLWQFNQEDTLGPTFLGLPIEEYLFYVSGSAQVISVWEVFKLMIAGTAPVVYWIFAGIVVWSSITLAIPYLFRPKGDKLL